MESLINGLSIIEAEEGRIDDENRSASDAESSYDTSDAEDIDNEQAEAHALN